MGSTVLEDILSSRDVDFDPKFKSTNTVTGGGLVDLHIYERGCTTRTGKQAS